MGNKVFYLISLITLVLIVGCTHVKEDKKGIDSTTNSQAGQQHPKADCIGSA
jgi:hypothetical protein